MYFIFLFLSFLLIQVINAICNCVNGDTVCLEQCVTKGQNCVVNCDGDIDCFRQCIQIHWPGQTMSSVEMVTSVAKTIPSMTTTSFTTTTTATISNNHTVIRQPAVGISTFAPIPPTSPTAPSQTSYNNNNNSKSFLIPAVAIGVASITVIVQFFFLARMGTMLFH